MRRAWLVILLAAPAGAEDDLDALVKDLGSAQYAVRDHAYRTLAQRKDARVIPKIENGLPSWKPENQYRALLVIGAFPPKQSHPVLRRLLKSKDPHLRMCGATQLHQRGEKGMEPVIAGILRGPVPEEMLDPVVARVRYLRLGSVHEAWAALITPKRKELTLYVWLASLSSEGFEGAQPQAKRIVDEDPRSGPRAVACAYLIRCHDSSYAATLARIIVEQPLDTSAASRVRYLLRDGRNYPATVCEAILKRLPEEKNESVAVAYIGILAAARHYPARKPLGALVEHESARVAEAALGALSELNSAPDTDVVRRMLDAKEPSRRLMAARILRRMDDLSGLEPTLRIAREGEDVLTRREAVKLLGEFRRAGAVDTLIEALYDEDGLTRSHAARSLQYTLHAIFPFRRFELRTAGYDSGAPRAERLAAIRRIRDWWDKHRAAVGSTPAR